MDALLRVYLELNRLKQLQRQGWLRRGVPAERCESVAEHTMGVAALALFCADARRPDLDRDKLLRMAVLHDFGEIDAGDLTPADGVPAEEKHRREAAAFDRVLGGLPAGDEYRRLWQEYAEGTSPEARFLREVDRLEMALQAIVYERGGFGDLSEFLESADEAIASSEMRELFDGLSELRRR